MANKTLFRSASTVSPDADTTNAAGGRAYKFSPKHALAQIAATNCFNGTYYVNAEDNLKIAKDAAQKLADDPEFIARVAVYSRKKGYMKDMPAFLTAMLATTDTELFRRVFPKVIDNGKMLRNFVQIARSGQTGRVLNLTSRAVRSAIRDWFQSKPSWVIFKGAIGSDPSMRDVLRMARPKPGNAEKAALFAYLCGAEVSDNKLLIKGPDNSQREHNFEDLPQDVQDYENYKRTKEGAVPKVDFRYLDSLGLGKEEWTEVARNAPWMMTRMNLNTFSRHGVFEDKEVTELIANRLRDPELIQKARAFPYQLLMAWNAISSDIPHVIREALQDAMEVAVSNAPEIPGKIYVAVDVSGSMSCAITGYRRGSTSAVRCVDVAALFAASIMRNNRSAEVLPFDTRIHTHKLNARDTVLTNAAQLARFGGGGTNCGLALEELNRRNAKGDAVIFVSDCESWVDSPYHSYYGSRGTSMMDGWLKFKARNKNAKMICIDLTPRPNTQLKEKEDILQVGGFSDNVFEVVKNFVEQGHGKDHWVNEIESIEI